MNSWPSLPRIWRSTMVAVCAVMIGGCAGLPRIDPTGERVFVWPQQQAQPVAPAIGNVQVQPVLTDPVFPSPSLPPTIGGTAVGIPPVPQDSLIISPQRVLAPVGSEVILKSGLCTSEKFLLTKTRINWLIARESAGEFVSLGGRGWLKNPWLPWNKPKKIDNQYATGYAATVPLTITRGTQDPRDDVQVQPGEAWVSVTSPVEGTSRITAMTPEIETWSQRKAIATIYWVDVQWSFPPPSISAGGSQVLTTTVRRQTDGTPLEGWIVRYEVAGGGGSLRGSQSDQVVEVRTDANGTASIDVTPTGEGGNTTQINTRLVRPERYRDSDAPELIIANGTTTISWSGSDYLPPPDDLGSLPPTGSLPPATTPTIPQQPAPPAVRRKPVLEIEIFGDTEVQAGQRVNYEIVIKNVGDGEATGIEMRDRFVQGLSHPGDTLKRNEISKSILKTIAPGASITESFYLDLDVSSSGSLSHVVSVSCAEGARAERQVTVNAIQPVPQKRAAMKVEKTGPRRRTVNEIAQFTLVITNTGEVPLTDLEIVDEYDRALRATPNEPGFERVSRTDGLDQFRWRVPRLEVGAKHQIDVQCQCVAQNLAARSTVQVTAETGTALGRIAGADEHVLEILPSPNVLPEGASAPGADVVPPRTGGGTLAVGITLPAQAVRVGQLTTFQVVVANQSTVSESNVRLVVTLPQELTPNVNNITNNANVRVQLVGNQLQFQAVTELRPGERIDYRIQVTAAQSGARNIKAEVTSRAATTPKRDVKQIEILGG